MKVNKKLATKILIAIGVATLILGLGFAGYFLYSYYNSLPYDKSAYQAATNSQAYNVNELPSVIEIIPTAQTNTKSIGLILYPGAFAKPEGYVPVLAGLAEEGVSAFIVKSPLNFALLNTKSASEIIRSKPTITDWYLAGHSLGGVAACEYAKSDSAKLKGLIMLASFCNGSGADLKLPVISISATNDGLTDTKDVENSRSKLPSGTRFVIINGGNHTQFGAFSSLQPGDREANISPNDQASQIVLAIKQFIGL